MTMEGELLINNVLPFWSKNGVDRDCGGMITCLRRDGTVYDYEKNAWFAGRAMYTYALCYNELCKDPEHLDICENMYRFVVK